ncbi:MAG: hypothetical protein QM796_21035 [Chthoniobacteraceae bacterium]
MPLQPWEIITGSYWITGVVEVRLANGAGTKTYLMHHEGRLIIYSHHGSKREVLAAILSALAAPKLNILHAVSRSPSTAEQHRLDQFIQLYLDLILPTLILPEKRSPQVDGTWKQVI